VNEYTDPATGEVVTMQSSGLMSMATVDPERALEKLSAVANAVAKVIRMRGLAVKIGTSEHVRIEGWQFAGTLLGVTCRTDWVREVTTPDGDVGFRARVTTLWNGQEIGAAEAVCMASEALQRRDGQRVARWTEAHQVNSMAQTRAQSKAYAMALRFVMVLGGFAGTPAEEMHGTAADNGTRDESGDRPITEAMGKRLWAIAYERARHSGHDKEWAMGKMRAMLTKRGLKRVDEIPASQYDAVSREVDGFGRGEEDDDAQS